MKLIDDSKLITCVLPRGKGAALLQALIDEKAVITGSVATGRGVSGRTGSFAEEVDILTVPIAAERADEVFDFLYERSDLDHTLGRFMFQAPLSAANLFAMPEPAELEAVG